MKFIKKTILILFLLLASCFLLHFSPSALAASYQMIFWYPGEAGGTEEAQTVLDEFFDYINAKIAPDKISGKYFNSKTDGLSFIKNSKPKVGILSLAAYEINKEYLGETFILLRTLPLPHGKAKENYVVVGKGKPPAEWDSVNLCAKQPLTLEFVKKRIFGLNFNFHLNEIPNLLPALKNVAEGKSHCAVILQPIEYFTLSNLNQPWAKSLSVWHKSTDIPSAPLVAFGPADAFAQKFKSVLQRMHEDAKGREILSLLRLKGFE